MNRWNIPDWLEREVIKRDRVCVYCGVAFRSAAGERRSRPSWEHIVNDARIVTRENIARCCMGCNASKGAKPLAVWLASRYCLNRGITVDTIAPVARAALAAPFSYRTQEPAGASALVIGTRMKPLRLALGSMGRILVGPDLGLLG